MGYFMEYVTWFSEFAYWLLPDFANAPGPCWDRGEMAMAIARLFCPLLLSTSDTAFFPLYSFAVLGAAGHNRWGVAETPLPVKTQGRNLDRGLTFKPTPCVGCLLSPRGDQRSEGHRPQNRTAKGADTIFAQGALGARDRLCGRRPGYRQWPTGQYCTLAHGARMRQRGADPGTGHSPRGRRCEHPSQGDHPQNWRATSPGPTGDATF